jgi:prepilin-type N-terminal cleavage/methylation domain-containing protein/prepilin-type processing-associated H-X9-DG protein
MSCASTRRRGVREGFTLVELLVVIGIIAVLISMLLPALNKVRSQSMALQCGANLRQLGIAFQMYANDNRGRLPSLWDENTKLWWYHEITPYMGKRAKDKSQYRFGYNGVDTSVFERFMPCPAREPHVRHDQSYGVNYTGVFSYWVDARNHPPGSSLGDPAFYGSARLSKVPAYVWVAADLKTNVGTVPGGRTEILNPENSSWALNFDYDKDGVIDSCVNELFSIGPYNGVFPVHGGKGQLSNKNFGMGRYANFLFADGSVRLLHISQWAKNEGRMWGKYIPYNAYR